MDKDFKIDTEHNQVPSCGYAHGSPGAKNFNWIAAIDAWDYCDPYPLAEMLKNHIIPQELRPIIAEIILFNRKPNKKGAAKLKLPAESRMLLAATAVNLLSIGEAVLEKRTKPTYIDVADSEGIEINEARTRYQKVQKDTLAKIAKILNLSVESTENLIRELKRKLDHYPNI